MQLAQGLTMLEITAVIMGRTTTIYPTLLISEQNIVLVDTGFPGQLPLFREALEKAGFPFETLTKIIATHQDIDHIGTLPDLLRAAPRKLDVLATEADKPYIQEEQRQALKHRIEHPPKAPVDTTLADGEELPYGGGVVVIHTPGHTPGHLCLYHPESRTLIAADALTVAEGKLARPNPTVDADRTLAGRSLTKLARYEIESVITYHGGLYRGPANERIAELAE